MFANGWPMNVQSPRTYKDAYRMLHFTGCQPGIH
jgi:hypothetical protein